MNNIDWDKAPDWATGYGLLQGIFGIEEVWFNAEQYLPLRGDERYGPYPFGGGTGPHMYNSTMGKIRFQQQRPAPWTGSGLPPVGADVECTFAVEMHEIWHRGTVIFNGIQPEGDAFVVVDTGKFQACYRHDGTCLRPYRTPEQIAADERESHINGMLCHDALGGTRRGLAEALYDAGYRRVEQ